MLALVAGVVAACGGSAATGAPEATGTQAGATKAAASATDNATAGAPKALDACSLITADEAAAVLGEAVDPGVVPAPGAHSCLFSTHALSTNGVEISITSVADFKPTQKSITGLTITQVSGIGDAAYYVNMGMPYLVLNVRKGQTTFTTSVLLKGASESQVMAGEKSLALLILGRI
jgi:hypothetical protein